MAYNLLCQKLPIDIVKYCIVPFLLPSRNSVYRVRNNMIKILMHYKLYQGINKPNSKTVRFRIASAHHDYLRYMKFPYTYPSTIHYWKPWLKFMREWNSLGIKGIDKRDFYRSNYRFKPINFAQIVDYIWQRGYSTTYHCIKDVKPLELKNLIIEYQLNGLYPYLHNGL